MDPMPGAVHVRHYGPVTWDDQTAAGPPFTIERRPQGGSGSWDDITAHFIAMRGWADLVVSLRASAGSPCGGQIGFYKGFEYRITPVRDEQAPEALRCLGVEGDPLVAHGATGGYVYQFTVAQTCPEDLNGDVTVDSADLALLLGAWDETCLSAPCVCIADLSGNGGVAAEDLAMLLGAWGPCASSLLGGGLPPVVEAYEFESVEGYIDWLNSLTETELTEHIAEIIEMLFE